MDKKSYHLFSRPIVFLLLTAALVVVMAGCGNSKQENRLRTYGHDGYMGYSNSNPNLPNRYQYLNYDADGKLIDQVLAPLSGIEHSQIYFNGPTLHVTLKVNRSLSDAQAEQLRAKAQSVVQYNMPRYDVHVKVKR